MQPQPPSTQMIFSAERMYWSSAFEFKKMGAVLSFYSGSVAQKFRRCSQKRTSYGQRIIRLSYHRFNIEMNRNKIIGYLL